MPEITQEEYERLKKLEAEEEERRLAEMPTALSAPDEDLLGKLVNDGKIDVPRNVPAPKTGDFGVDSENPDSEADEPSTSMCQFNFAKACDKAGTWLCDKECDFHPESYSMEGEVREAFEKEPWRVYCLTCGKFLESRNELDHPEGHIMATGMAQYRELIPKFVMERMMARDAEDTEMSW